MIKINKQQLRDKIYACWIGKSIGGTIGAPFENNREFLDVKGFTSEKGEPIPNDDLDLQLVWLKALEDHGVRRINAALLGEYWLDLIVPEWNEYGICKANLSKGIHPPMSGELFNPKWKHSNGAWIRSEIWACLCPGLVDNAISLCIEDAMVDHGMGEGTYAEIFTTALESAAFIENDFRKLVKIGFSKIPKDCLVAKAVQTAINCYDAGIPLREARENVRKSVEELGWFQAPANLGYVALGVLYGEGDFKKSMLYAINCGDDTDCTGATIGSIMGIMYGTEGIPSDWQEYVGDKIVTCCIAENHYGSEKIPKDCGDLTDRVMALVSDAMNHLTRPYYYNDTMWQETRKMEFTDGETDYGDEFERTPIDSPLWAEIICDRAPYSYDVDLTYVTARVEFPCDPFVKVGETKRAKIRFFSNSSRTDSLEFRIMAPEGFVCKANHGTVVYRLRNDGPEPTLELEVTPEIKTEFVNRVVVEVTASNHTLVGYIPVNFIG